MHAYSALHRFLLRFSRLIYHQQCFMASVRLRKRGKSDSKPVKKLVKVEYEEDKVTIPEKVDVPIWEPKNWRDQFDNIRKMREKADAPVDNVGASKLADATVLPEVIVHM